MESIQKVAPQVIDGIEFYVSNDGNQVGMSQNGLARFCGVSLSTMSALVSSFASEGSNRLESFSGEVFHRSLTNIEGNAKILTSEFCVAAIEYYAFESKAKSSVALYSFRKFASIGFNSWVKKSVGLIENSDIKSLAACISELVGKVDVLTTEVVSMRDERKAIVTLYPNSGRLMDGAQVDLSKEEMDLFTVKEWLALNQIELEFGDLCKLGRLVSEAYTALTNQEPHNKYIRHNGKLKVVGKGYESKYFNLIETCYKTM